MGFAYNPVEYIHKLVAASATEVRHTHTERGDQVVHQISASENFALPWAQEAAIHFLTKTDQQMS
jgi:predicted ATPase